MSDDNKAALESRAQGCLLGQIAGDALGSMVEFQGPGRIERDFPGGPREIRGSKVFQTLPGQPTDDSELAILLARSIIRSGGYDQEAAARAYAWWYDSMPFDIGNATRRALSAASNAVGKGMKASEAAMSAADPATQANGALMRVSPLGIFGWFLDPVEIENVTRLDARLTHPNKVCQHANAVFVLAIARAVRTGEPASALYKFAHQWAKDHDTDASVIRAMEDAGSMPPGDFLTHAGWVLVALQNAFYQLLHASSFADGVVDTVRHGGDTDTNAAIAGALLGAVRGVEAVPAQWREAVANCRPEGVSPGYWDEASEVVICEHTWDREPVDSLSDSSSKIHFHRRHRTVRTQPECTSVISTWTTPFAVRRPHHEEANPRDFQREGTPVPVARAELLAGTSGATEKPYYSCI